MTWRLALTNLLVLILFALLAAQPAAAARVRSGEHKGFTRLVFPLDSKSKWALAKTDAGYELLISDQRESFDLRKVFTPIPKTRLQDITATQSTGGITVSLASACRCRATARELSNGRLVIDIKDGRAGSTAPVFFTNAPGFAEEMRSGTAISAAVNPITPEPTQNEAPSLPVGHSGQSSGQGAAKLPDRQVHLQLLQNRVKPPILPVPTDIELPDPDVAAAHDTLMAKLQSALDQGVLQAAEDFDTPAPPDVRSDAGEIASDHATDSAASRHLLLSARSVLDERLPKEGKPRTHACLAPDVLDVAAWDNGSAATSQIARLRAKLLGPLDQPDPVVLENLVRLYIGIGFGIEATALLDLFAGSVSHADVLRALAHVIEEESVYPSAVLATQTGCAGPAVFWSLFGTPFVTESPLPNFDLAVAYFGALPIGLRRLIGPKLGMLLIDSAKIDQARQIHALVARAAGPHGDNFLLFDARLNLARGRTAAGRETLRQIIAANSKNAPSAVVLLIDNLLEENRKIPEGLIVEAGARAFENRNSYIGQRLRFAEIKARAATQAQLDAFAIIEHEKSLGGVALIGLDHVIAEVFRSLERRRMGDLEFVNTVFAYRHLLTDSILMDDARRHLARQFLSAGLANVALNLMAPVRQRLQTGDNAFLASVYLALNQPAKALELLGDQSNTEHAALRGQAHFMLGNLTESLAQTENIDDRLLQQRRAWQAGDWARVAALGSENEKRAAGIMLPPVQDSPTLSTDPVDPSPVAEAQIHDPDPDLTLTGLRNLLKNSRASQTYLTGLLNDHPSPLPLPRESEPAPQN